jgi:hypothetical protein
MPPTRWIAALTILAAGIAAASTTGAAAESPPGGIRPDLVADPSDNTVLSTDATGSESRLLLRFNGYVHNAGSGALEMRGARSSTTAPMTVDQRVYDADGGFRDTPTAGRMIYEDGDGHHHWHLMHAARYSLWNTEGTAEVAPAMKTGFCLYDSERMETHGPADAIYGHVLDHHFCEQGDPGRLSLFQGISAGWRDIYSNRLAFQWVDVSSVQPGRYRLRSEVDPDNVISETRESNQATWAAAASTIPGYVAAPVERFGIAAGQATAVTLSAARFGSPGAPAYRIESAPAHGALDLATGASQSSASVEYRPAPGFEGVDSFTYSVRDSTSPFPRAAAVASVTLRVGAPTPAPSVQIAGAPASIVAGTSVQLMATVSGDAPGVAWTVDGAPGGDPTVGTISSTGLYTAPARPPAGGTVTIGARSAAGARDERVVRILPAPAPQPAPLPSAAVRGESRTAAGARLGAPRASRLGRRLIMTVTPARAGVVRLTAYTGRRRLGACSTRTPAGRRFTCRLRLPRTLRTSAAIRVVASLRVGGRVVAVRTRKAARVASGHLH